MRPRDADHAYDWLLERAEEAASAGLTLDKALQAVRDGFSSIEADRRIAEEDRPDQPGVVFCSDGPENGHRYVPHNLTVSFDQLSVQVGGRSFRWDGTYAETGDAHFRPTD